MEPHLAPCSGNVGAGRDPGACPAAGAVWVGVGAVGVGVGAVGEGVGAAGEEQPGGGDGARADAFFSPSRPRVLLVLPPLPAAPRLEASAGGGSMEPGTLGGRTVDGTRGRGRRAWGEGGKRAREKGEDARGKRRGCAREDC